MTTVKAFSQSQVLQLEMVLRTGAPSVGMLRKLEDDARHGSVEKALKRHRIAIDCVPLVTFKIGAIQELVDWADHVQTLCQSPFSSLPGILKHKRSETVLSRVRGPGGNLQQNAALNPARSLSVRTARLLVARVNELNKAHPAWESASLSDLKQIFAREVFKRVSLTLGDYLQLGAPDKPIYHSVMNEIIKQISTKIGEWQQPWRNSRTNSLPQNVKTRRYYTGINIITLWQAAHAQGYDSNVWGTSGHWRHVGATIRGGEVATPVFKFFPIQSNQRGNDFRVGIVPLFNAQQVDNWSGKKPKKAVEIQLVAEAEKLLAGVNPEIRPDTRAIYNHVDDFMVCRRLIRSRTRKGTMAPCCMSWCIGLGMPAETRGNSVPGSRSNIQGKSWWRNLEQHFSVQSLVWSARFPKAMPNT